MMYSTPLETATPFISFPTIFPDQKPRLTPLGTAKPLISFPQKFPNQKPRKDFFFSLKPTKSLQLSSRPRLFLPKASLNPKPSVSSDAENEDFMTRVMRENPNQVEPRYLIGDNLYTLKEKESLSRRYFSEMVSELLKRLNLKAAGKTDKEVGNEGDFVKPEGEIYLRDLLREYKGKLYVPDKVFGPKLSEEEVFDKNLNELPRMNYEDFQECLDYDKIKLVTFKESSGVSMYRDFVVNLKEIPGERSLHTTKWAIKLTGEQVKDLLATYKGPLNEIENQTMSWVGRVPEFPPPAASKLSSRMMVELGAITAAMTSTAFVIVAVSATGFFSVFDYSFTALGDVIVPAIWRVVTFSLDAVFGILKTIAENVVELLLDGGLVSQVFEVVDIGKPFSGVGVLKPVVAILLIMVLLIRFTLSRKPKIFKGWNIWQVTEFSKSKAQARVDGSTGVKFCDVAGIDDTLEELQENPELFDQLGIKAPHGVLLDGPPGCGKTLVAKAIAGEAGVPFYQMAGSEFVEAFVGVGAARVRDLFKRAKVNKPAVIFIDEIDALATRRSSRIANKTADENTESKTEERDIALNQLLTELDGFGTGKGVIFLGATNRRDLLDPALLRPGRFDRKIKVRAPNAKGRLEILKVHARKVKLSDTVDLATYANNLPGWTGAKLAHLLQEAALVAVRKGHTAILPSDMDNAVDRLTVGPKHIGVKLSHEGQCHRAATEGGTALVSQLLRHFENAKVEQCARVSINPHGKALSQLVYNRLEDEAYKYECKPQLLHRLQVFLAARAAEEVIFGRDTSMASVGSLANASWLARKIITIWNMENPMALYGSPPWRKTVKPIGPKIDFEGHLYHTYRAIAPPIKLNLIDDVATRTEELMQDMYKKTVDLLRRHNAALLKTVKVLVDKRELSGAEIDLIIDKYPPGTPASNVLKERDTASLPLFEEKQEQSN